MSDDITSNTPNLLTAAEDALGVLLPVPFQGEDRSDEQAIRDRLRRAVEAYRLNGDEREAKLPLAPVDSAINNLLRGLQARYSFITWLDERREIFTRHLPKEGYRGAISFDHYSDWSLSIYGVVDARGLAKELGGHWGREINNHAREEHMVVWDFKCKSVPGLAEGVAVTIASAEKEPKVQSQPLPL